MKPGPCYAHECPHCGGIGFEGTWASMNTFWARFWTDGAIEDEARGTRWFIRCPHCATPYWLYDDSRAVHLCDLPFEDHERFPSGLRVEPTTLDDVIDALDDAGDGDLTASQERFLRRRAWHELNDPRRDLGQPATPLSDFERRNLRRLLAMKDDEPMGLSHYRLGLWQIEYAEIYRELGDFERAQRQIENYLRAHPKDADDPYAVAHVIATRIAARDWRVAPVPERPWRR